MRTDFENWADELIADAREEIGSVDELGHYALIDLSPADLAECPDALTGDEVAMIVNTDSQGFLNIEMFHDRTTAHRAWQEIVDTYGAWQEDDPS